MWHHFKQLSTGYQLANQLYLFPRGRFNAILPAHPAVRQRIRTWWLAVPNTAGLGGLPHNHRHECGIVQRKKVGHGVAFFRMKKDADMYYHLR